MYCKCIKPYILGSVQLDFFFNSNELQTAALDDVPLKSNFNVFCVIKCIYCEKTWRYLTIFALKTTPEEDCEPLSNNSEW